MSKFIKIRCQTGIAIGGKEHKNNAIEIVLNVDQINFISHNGGTWFLCIKNNKNPLLISEATAEAIIDKLKDSRMMLMEEKE